MKKFVPVLSVSLLVSLFIYLFYRTERTLVNQVVIALFSEESYFSVKDNVVSALPLHDFIIYSLPEGLWVFCITITSGFFYLSIGNRKWNLTFLPVLLAIIMEILQLLNFTNGRFDLADIAFSAIFWLLAVLMTKDIPKEPLYSYSTKSACCVFSYVIVYMAHVNS